MKNQNRSRKRFGSRISVIGYLLATFFIAQSGLAEEKIAGIWQGKLNIAPGASLRIVFHISETDSGKLAAKMDSPDQKVTDIAVDEVKFENNALSLKISSIQGAFKGKAELAKKAIDGTWSQGGRSMPLKLEKVAAAKMFKASEKKEIELSEEIMQKYTGKYELQPGAVISITLDGKKMMAQITGQPALQIFPETETKFFYKAVEASIEFNLDEDGQAESLTLDQFGRKLVAKKME